MNHATILWIYIAFLVVGGLMGYFKGKSAISLIMSLAFAIPLALCAAGKIHVHYLPEILIGFLLIFFASRFAKKKSFMPGGLMTILSAAALVGLLVQ